MAKNKRIKSSAVVTAVSNTQFEWRRPETAPLDGQPVLGSFGGVVTVAYLRQTWNWQKFKSERFWEPLWSGGHVPGETKMDGWMPLPKPIERAVA